MAKRRKPAAKAASTGVIIYVITADAETGAVLQMERQDPPDKKQIPNLRPIVSVDIAVNTRLGAEMGPPAVTGPQLPPSVEARQVRSRGGRRRKGPQARGQAPEI
jgi:hypothetical protein